MFEALGDLPAAPFLGGLFLRGVAALIAFGERDQSLGRAFGFAFHLAVEDDVLARIAQFRVDRVLDVELARVDRSEEHPSELQSLMRISYAVFSLKKQKHTTTNDIIHCIDAVNT